MVCYRHYTKIIKLLDGWWIGVDEECNSIDLMNDTIDIDSSNSVIPLIYFPSDSTFDYTYEGTKPPKKIETMFRMYCLSDKIRT